MKPKFKVGDKVRILSTSSVDGITNHGVEVGMIGEVCNIEVGIDVAHKDFERGFWTFNDDNLELVVENLKFDLLKQKIECLLDETGYLQNTGLNENYVDGQIRGIEKCIEVLEEFIKEQSEG